MAFEAFDPRKVIRTAIGANHSVNGTIQRCISITDKNGNPAHIPMYVREETAVECPPLPHIVIDLLGIRAVPGNIQASVRDHVALLSFDIRFNDAANIDVTSFGKKVADVIVDETRTLQSTTTGITFMNVINQGRIHVEERCEEIILHWIMELEALFIDAC